MPLSCSLDNLAQISVRRRWTGNLILNLCLIPIASYNEFVLMLHSLLIPLSSCQYGHPNWHSAVCLLTCSPLALTLLYLALSLCSPWPCYLRDVWLLVVVWWSHLAPVIPPWFFFLTEAFQVWWMVYFCSPLKFKVLTLSDNHCYIKSCLGACDIWKLWLDMLNYHHIFQEWFLNYMGLKV